MQGYEVDPVLEGLQYTDRNQWEQTRLRIYATASMFSKQKMGVQDIMTFPWETDTTEPDTNMTNTDKERLAKRAEEIAKSLK